MVRVLAFAGVASVAAAASNMVNNHFRVTDLLHKFEETTSEAVTAGVPENWFDQKLDHNNPSNPQQWKQRYFFSDQFYGGPGSPVFLYIEGESVASNRTVVSSGLFMNELAKKHKALVVSLEHRFYGKSQPFPTLATEGLQYLRAEQALADLVNFQDFFSAKQNLTKDNKWVAFGGSYPGMLAGWLKLKYPDRFVGTVASSAPINTKIDFFEYADIVSEGLRYFGGDSCVKTLTDATTELHRLLASSQPEDVATLQKYFNPCFEFGSDDDRGTFEQQIFSAFQGTAQYNDYDADGSTGLTKICKALEGQASPIEKLSKLIGNTGGDKCTYNKWQGYVDYYQDTSIGEDSWSRPWFYQTCAEFGFAQVTATSHGAFAPLTYANTDVVQNKLCNAVFNINDGEARTAATIKKYGGLKVDVSNVIWPTGTIDPWAGLALSNKTGAVNARSEVVDILGTSHCRDMYSRKAADSGHLVWAHQRIEAAVEGYLHDKC